MSLQSDADSFLSARSHWRTWFCSLFFLIGEYILRFLGLQQEAVSIAGGIVLFLIALRMIFPGERPLAGDALEGEPFLVPLAIPLIAGPSALATLLLLQRSGASKEGLLLALTIAWMVSAILLLSSTFLYRVLKRARTYRPRAIDGDAARDGGRADVTQRPQNVLGPLTNAGCAFSATVWTVGGKRSR